MPTQESPSAYTPMLRRLFLDLFGPRFWIPAYLALAGGLFLPGDWSALKPAVPFCLGFILLFTCLRVSAHDLAAGLADPAVRHRLAWMTAAKLLALPLLIWACIAPLSPAWAAGTALVCLMPAGMSSAAFCDLYGGNRVLGLALIAATSALAPLTIPPIMAVIAPGSTTPDVWALLRQSGYILVILALPFAVAQVIRSAAPAFVERHRDDWSRWSIAALCTMILISVGANRGAWSAWGYADLLLPFALACAASALTAAICLGVRRRIGHADATALACACIYMNNGLGIAYASAFLPGDAHGILPAVLMQIPMLGMMAWWGRLAPPPPVASR